MKEIDCFVHEDVLYTKESELNSALIIERYNDKTLSEEFDLFYSTKEPSIIRKLRSKVIKTKDCNFCNSEDLKLTNPEYFI